MFGNTARKKVHLNTVSVNLGCSCSRPKLSLLFHPKPKLKTHQKPHKRHNYLANSSSSSWTNDFNDDTTTKTTTTTTTTTTANTPTTTTATGTPFYTNDDVPKKKKSSKRNNGGCGSGGGRGFGRVGGEGVAVEKDSDDPYLDFRHSMLQMILENEIYSKDDLRELLNCFLQLNSPSHHGIIVRAFAEIWDGVFSVRSAGPTAKMQYYGYNKSLDYY